MKAIRTPRERRPDQAERRWQAISECSFDAALMLDARGVVVYAGASLTNVLGYAPEEFIGCLGFDFIHPEDVERVAAEFFRVAAQSGASATVKGRALHKSGRWLWVEATAKNRTDAAAVQAIVVGFRDVSEREEAAQRQAELSGRLQTQAAALQAVLSASVDDIYVFDQGGRCVMVSQGGAKTFGRQPGEIVGRSFREVGLPEEVAGGLQANLERAISERRPLRSEFQLAGEDGPRCFEYVITPVGEGHSAELATVISRDITARKQTEEALRERAGRLRVALAAADLGTWDVDLANNVLRDDDRLAEMLELPPCQGMRQPEEWLARIHPDDRDRVRREFEAAVIANADEFGTTHRIVLPDGEQRWVAPQGVILRDEAGQPLGAVGVCADVTAAQQAEHALRRERELLQTIIDSIPVMITIYDPDTNVLRLNPEFERVTGWTAADARGGSLMEQCYPDPGYREQVRRFMVACGSGWKDLQMCGRDGRQVETTWANIRLTNGLRVGIGLDATERRRTEVTLRDADRRKDEFLAMLAHELRNPLAPILAAVQILHIVGADEAAVKQQRELIERQVQQMRRLLDDLLDVSRITRGKIQLGQELVDLSAVLAQAIESSRPMVEAKGHGLTAVLGQEPLWIKADRLRLAQVFTNLLNNAAKYTDPGGRITIGVERCGEWAAATVRDSGIGMTPDVLSNAFDLFAQADNSLHRAQGGLGIGLTVAKRLVEMHGGVIAAGSQGLGLGSEFTVRLPLVAPPADASGDAEAEAEPPTGPSRRVLVVDDNADAAQTLAMLLRLQGHDVRVAFDGLEGLEVAREYGPDIVLLDIGLPKMDGYETARALRASTATQRAVLIAVSGYGQAEDRRRSVEAGFDQHFVKPLDSAILQQAFAAIGPANLASP